MLKPIVRSSSIGAECSLASLTSISTAFPPNGSDTNQNG
jgi:hypothetical protein